MDYLYTIDKKRQSHLCNPTSLIFCLRTKSSLTKWKKAIQLIFIKK
ncbi:unnamed protein product [Nezara viridula]|uniref:Uncharacterized protein n=1 Tax=Nezara viridula TaxID=85310 RepID=A0A9P0HBT6_NEZVI|nr:unnamed protein product [Nezara viridula]